MRHNILWCASLAIVTLCSTASASVFSFNQDPFAGTNVLNTPGRQIVGGEDFISFSTGQDVFALDSTVFGTDTTVHFVNAAAGNIPSSGVNVIVLETFDNDNNPQTPFGAGNAADLIANQITTAGAGFFVYFNQSLDLPRLVYSTDLSSSTADLKVLARMLNLTGPSGRDALEGFTAQNFRITSAGADTPEPSSVSMIAMGGFFAVGCLLRRRRRDA